MSAFDRPSRDHPLRQERVVENVDCAQHSAHDSLNHEQLDRNDEGRLFGAPR